MEEEDFQDYLNEAVTNEQRMRDLEWKTYLNEKARKRIAWIFSTLFGGAATAITWVLVHNFMSR